MGSQSLLQLPTIDFSNIHKNDRGTIVWDCTKTQVFKALEEYGCFETSLTTQISPDLLRSVFASLKQLFDLPLETKLRNLDPKPIHGYVGPSKDVPLYESLGMEDIESFTNLMWPQGNHEFCKTVQEYVKKLKEMNEIVRMMVLESLNLDKYMAEHMELTKHLIRVMKYRVPEENESDLGLKSHADRNLMTIIQQNEAGGLEIQTKEGEWIKMKNSSNCIIVMAGETFHVWTNGRLHAPVHKVLMTNDLTRYSIGLFLVPKFGKIVKAPEEMVDDEYPLLYKPFNYEDFLNFFVLEENIDDKLAMKKFCGVLQQK